jgi:predicted transposase YbfD/YdcC
MAVPSAVQQFLVPEIARARRENHPDVTPLIALCSVLCGGQTGTAMALFVRTKETSLCAIGKVVRERETDGKTSSETACAVLSTPMSADRFNQVVRFHWRVENRPHWRLEAAMNEDRASSRVRGEGHERPRVPSPATNRLGPSRVGKG